MLVNFGYLKSIPRGEAIVLSAALAGYFYMFRKKILNEGTTKILK